jgi:hypothetical protein
MSEDNTRPISVAELLARNGTIGSPPVSGHRRRKRRDAVSVADLTGEIPIVHTGAIPVVADDEPHGEDEPAAEHVEPEAAETVVVYAAAQDTETVESLDTNETVADTPDYGDTPDLTPDYTHTADIDAGEATVEVADVVELDEAAVDEAADVEVTLEAEAVESVEVLEPEDAASAPPRSSFPRPRRRRGPQRSHDPRPRRRSSDAERMAYDPVDESVDLDELVAEHAPDAEELRSYLRSSTGTLFSGETVADDLARRGLTSDADEDYDPAGVVEAPRRGALSVVGTSVVVILQSLFAVVFGAGLFIAFDQLWRWNNIVALALSTLVIVALVIGVHVVRKTEDFVSILIAVAVGILVTFGPLALQST